MIGNTGVSLQAVNSAIASAISATPQATTFINNGQPVTLAQLYSTYPASTTYRGQYARVSNLFNGSSTSATGGIDDIVRCRWDETNQVFRWIPQREAFNLSLTPASGTVSLIPLVTPPTVRLAGTLTGNLTVTPSSSNAYIGETFTIIQNSVLGAFLTQITGLLGSNLTLLGNTTQVLEYTAGGWIKSVP